MRRRDRLIFQFIVWLAVGTFLFGIWVLVVGIRKSPPSQAQPALISTNINPAPTPPQ